MTSEWGSLAKRVSDKAILQQLTLRFADHFVAFPAVMAINQNRDSTVAVVNSETRRVSSATVPQDAKQAKRIDLDNGDIAPLKNVIVH